MDRPETPVPAPWRGRHTRLQDRIDAQHLLQFTPSLDISRVREHLARITDRGYAREQNLEAKLAVVLHDVGYLKR